MTEQEQKEDEHYNSPKRRKLMVNDNDDEDDVISTDDEDDYGSSIGTVSSDSDDDDDEDIQSEYETEPEADDDQSHDEGCNEEIDEDIDDNWKTVAIGWSNILKYIQSDSMFTEIFGTKEKQHIDKVDVDNYLGKDWEWRKSYGYIKKLDTNSTDFALQIHKKNKFITKWINVKSKWRSSKKYVVMIGFFQIYLYNQSMKKSFYEKKNNIDKAERIKIKEDEMHWYEWIKNDRNEPVSVYLSEKYRDIQKTLEERRVSRMIRSRKYYYGTINVGVMNKEDLLYFAKEHAVDIPNNIQKKKKLIRDHVLDELKKRKKKEWENNQTCFNDGCDNKATKRCSSCKGAYYCCPDCQMSHWDQHKLKCSKLFAAQEQEFIIGSQTRLFPSLEEIDKLRKNAIVPESLSYLKKYPRKQKSWYDLDFRLFDSKLARLQHRCSCRSGVQLPGVCAHCGCILRLIFCVLFQDIKELLRKNKRDRLIYENIVDLTPFSKEQKRLRKEYDHWCPLCGHPTKDTCVQCDICNRWYHPSCIKTSLKDIEQDKFASTVFHCPMCNTNDAWVVRNT